MRRCSHSILHLRLHLTIQNIDSRTGSRRLSFLGTQLSPRHIGGGESSCLLFRAREKDRKGSVRRVACVLRREIMFRIVENTDGSTSILDRMSGKLLTVIPAKNRVKESKGPSPSRTVTSSVPSTPTTQRHAFQNSCNRISSSASRPTPGAPTPDQKADEPLSSPISRSDTVSKSSAGTSEPVRRLRPRNIQPEYNEDRAFEALIHSGTGLLSVPYTVSEAPEGCNRKPDHLVVVYKHSPERQAETPNRMRLLPAVTLNKLQAGLHHPKAVILAAPSAGSFPVEVSEPENDCIDQTTFNQYLNLIPASAVTKRTSTELKQKWPLRLHSRTSPSSRSKKSIQSKYSNPAQRSPITNHKSQLSVGGKNALTELQTRSEVEKNIWFSSIKSNERFVTSQKTPQNVLHVDPNGVLHLIPSVGGLSENGIVAKQSHVIRKQSSGSSCSSTDIRSCPPHDRDLFFSLPVNSMCETMKSEQRKTMLRRFVKKYHLKPADHYKPGVEMSSPLGKRLLDAYTTIVNLQSVAEVLRFVRSYDRHCSTSIAMHKHLLQSIKCSFSPKVRVEFGMPSPSKSNLLTSRILRSQLTISSTSNAWGLKSYHIYAFSKQERLEKSLTMTCGLDWKARLLALHCEDISVAASASPVIDHLSLIPPDQRSPGVRTPELQPASSTTADSAVIELDDSYDEVCVTQLVAHDQNQNQMILCDEDEEEMEEDEEVILIGGSSSYCCPSASAARPETSSNFLPVTPNRSPVEVLIEF